MTLIQLIFYLTLLTKRANPIEYDTITQITNTFREAYGCRPVSEDDNLTRAAQARADEIFESGHFSHDGVWETVEPIYRYRAAGENLARNFNTDEAMVVAWMKSPKHRENIVNCKYKDIGIGRRDDYVVQLFGRK